MGVVWFQNSLVLTISTSPILFPERVSVECLLSPTDKKHWTCYSAVIWLSLYFANAWSYPHDPKWLEWTHIQYPCEHEPWFIRDHDLLCSPSRECMYNLTEHMFNVSFEQGSSKARTWHHINWPLMWSNVTFQIYFARQIFILWKRFTYLLFFKAQLYYFPSHLIAKLLAIIYWMPLYHASCT